MTTKTRFSVELTEQDAKILADLTRQEFLNLLTIAESSTDEHIRQHAVAEMDALRPIRNTFGGMVGCTYWGREM